MSEEKKRVPTGGEILDVEAAIKTFDGAAAMAAKTMSIFNEESNAGVVTTIDAELNSTITENIAMSRTLRTWLGSARSARESEDLARKKAGLS